MRKAGMPTSSVQAAEKWRSQHIDPGIGRPAAAKDAAAAAADRRAAVARLQYAESKARLAMLDLKEREGSLLRADDVRHTTNRLAAEVVGALTSLPGRLAPLLIAMPDYAAAYRVLSDGIRDTRVEISAAVRRSIAEKSATATAEAAQEAEK